MIPESLFETAFGLSFLAGVGTGLILFTALFPHANKKIRDYNSPRYLASLLLGFLGGVIAESVISLLFGPDIFDPMTFWLFFGIELPAGVIVIAIILLYLLRAAHRDESPVT